MFSRKNINNCLRRDIHNCSINWLHGASNLIWLDDECITKLPPPLGISISREIERQLLAIMGEVRSTHHFITQLMNQNLENFVDEVYVSRILDLQNPDKHLVTFNRGMEKVWLGARHKQALVHDWRRCCFISSLEKVAHIASGESTNHPSFI